MTCIDKIMAYENGELDQQGVIDLFQDLVNDGSAWTLQGSYGRMAQALLDAGHIQCAPKPAQPAPRKEQS